MDAREREFNDLKDDVNENVFQIEQFRRLIHGLRSDVDQLKVRVTSCEGAERATIYHLQRYAATLQADLARTHMLLRQAKDTQSGIVPVRWPLTLAEQVEKELATKNEPEEDA